MRRVLGCEGIDALMEVYLPESVISGSGVNNVNLASPVLGLYALDLSAAHKGKPLEPVRVSLSSDRRAIIVDQFTRGLPPTHVPVGGGTVDFDHRFGTRAKCAAFNTRPEDAAEGTAPAAASSTIGGGTSSAAQTPPPTAESMLLDVRCKGIDANMEIYVPEAVEAGEGLLALPAGRMFFGAYALDLSAAGKGKVLEPVRLSISADRKSFVVDQFTRGLPPTNVPFTGGTVDFDMRFATGAVCAELGER